MVDELGISEYVDVETFTTDELIDQVKKALDNLDQRRIILEKNTNKKKEKAKENISIALELLNK